jgi:hypothetical protein
MIHHFSLLVDLLTSNSRQLNFGRDETSCFVVTSQAQYNDEEEVSMKAVLFSRAIISKEKNLCQVSGSRPKPLP